MYRCGGLFALLLTVAVAGACGGSSDGGQAEPQLDVDTSVAAFADLTTVTTSPPSTTIGLVSSTTETPTTTATSTTSTSEAPATTTSSTTTTSAAPEPQDSDISIIRIRYDGPGNDVEAEDSEYVELQNDAAATIDLSGWSVTDLKDHMIRIPTGFFIEAGSTFRIYTGPGTNVEGSRYYDGRGQAIWNNSGGDEATLRNRSGEVIGTYSYSS